MKFEAVQLQASARMQGCGDGRLDTNNHSSWIFHWTSLSGSLLSLVVLDDFLVNQLGD